MDSLIHQSTFESQGVNMYNLKYLEHIWEESFITLECFWIIGLNNKSQVDVTALHVPGDTLRPG